MYYRDKNIDWVKMNSYGWNKEIYEPEFVRQETKKIEVSTILLFQFLKQFRELLQFFF